jgi:two-component system, NtrC family, sensor histidine kinase HydH
MMVPISKHSFRFSKPALALILASSLLAVLLTVSTIRNLNSEQKFFEESLLREGITVIRSFGAGVRMSMRHRMTGSEMLQTLVEETVQEKGVRFIRIMRQDGGIVAEAGDLPDVLEREELRQIFSTRETFTHTIQETNTFEIIRVFKPVPPPEMMGRMGKKEHRHRMQEAFRKQSPRVIVVGLSTAEFDNARQEDKMHAWLMGAVLFLLGSAGLYFVFLYQSFRVTRSTLANMRIYTENVIESMPTGLVSLDENDAVASINSMAEQLLNEMDCDIKGFLGGIHTNNAEQEIFCSSRCGEKIPVKVSVSPLLDHKGGSSGKVLILQDMREIRKIEQQLELSRRLASLGRMAAGIAHEIRNPLGTLRGFAQYFGKEAETDSDGQKYAELMVSEVDRLNESISTLLQFARAPEPQSVQVGVKELFAKVTSLLVADCGAAGITLTQDFQEGEKVYADPDLLLQVLLNLIQNSIRVTEPGGKIYMKLYRQNSHSVLEIVDTGQGMSAEVQKQIFDPFFSTRKEGTGLGLAISHQIVEQHHGQIEVTSSEGQGTTMKVILPGGPNG